MTRIDYTSMTDDELTRAVAERAGWTNLVWFGDDAEQGSGLYCTGDHHYGHKVPNFATDIVAAMGLLEQFHQWEVQRAAGAAKIIPEPAGGWSIRRGDMEIGGYVVRVGGAITNGKSLPRSICLAYIAATEKEGVGE